MTEYQYFQPLPDMVGEPCDKCGQPIESCDVLIQENRPGGGRALLHRHCLDNLGDDGLEALPDGEDH